MTDDVQMLVQRQEAEREMTERLQKMQVDKQIAVEMAASLQRSLQAANDRQTTQSKLHNDKKTLDKVCRGQFRHS